MDDLERQRIQRRKLMEVDTERLVDALVEIAVYNRDIADFVDRMVSTNDENKDRVLRKLASFKDRKYAHYGDEAHAFWVELMALLEDVKAASSSPLDGVELIASIFRTDKDILENCDSSDGEIGSFFMDDVTELFIFFGAQCNDKQWLCNIAVELCREDDYCVRRRIAERASEYLPGPLAIMLEDGEMEK